MTLIWRELKQRGFAYWIRVVVFAVFGAWLGHWVGEHGFWMDLRYQLHQIMSELAPRPAQPRQTAVVIIGDEEYWRGDLASRSPLKRDYLARLLDAVDQADPTLIALDVDLRSPDPARPLIHNDYRSETRQLFRSIHRIAEKRPIVLARTLGQKSDGEYLLEADIYDEQLPCRGVPRPGADQSTGHRDNELHCGYIALPRDARLLPPRLALEGGASVDSFSLAIVKALKSRVGQSHGQLSLGYGSFIPRRRFIEEGLVLSADTVIRSHESRRRLAHRIVLIGGEWSGRAYGRGGHADMHASPVGLISGVFLHANYAEALLDGRVYSSTVEWLPTAVEFVLVLFAAIVFARNTAAWRKIVLSVALCFSLLLVAYVLFQNFGRFFDGVVPVIFVGLHAAVDQVWEWRTEAYAHRRRLTGEGQ